MAIKLITGLKESEDIQSEDDGARIYGTISSGDRVLEVGEKFAYQIISNNCVRIKSGELLMQGRHARQAPNTYTDLTISNGTQSMQRNDLIVVRYTKDSSTGLENVELAIVEGTPGSTGVDPEITTGDIFEGRTLHEMPLYRVKIDGLSIDSVAALFTTLGNLESYSTSKIYTATLSTNWSGSSAPYTQNVSITGISSEDTPVIDVILDSNTETALNQLEAWGCVSKITKGTNQITATCLEDKPAVAIPIQIKVV